MTSTHTAVILPSRFAAPVLEERPTPTPGPRELLIRVKAIALNPIDRGQKKYGLPAINYPAIIGSDIAGTVVSVGVSVGPDAPQPGARVTAFAPSFFAKGSPNYGAFQELVLVPAENVTPIPDSMGFNEASALPMAVQTAWLGWLQAGLTRDKVYTPAEKKGVLVWGAGGSVGCAAVQIAKAMGCTVYATASKKNHAYLKGLGAHQLFDYKDADVVAQIVKAAQAEGISLDVAYIASGDVMPCVNALRQMKGPQMPRIAMAPFKPVTLLWMFFPTWRGVRLQFVAHPKDERERQDLFHFVFRVWLKDKLKSGEFVASPKIQVLEGGLKSMDSGTEQFKDGVSAVKLVLEV